MSVIGKFGNSRSVSFLRIAGAVLAAGAAYVVVRELPALGRYLQMSLKVKRGGGGAKLLVTGHEPQFAQGPRRAGEGDAHRGHERRL